MLSPMNITHKISSRISVCPHDCPSQCALEVEVLDERTIGRLRGARANSYTAGVICEKVARYAERIHHPDRLTRPLRRRGPKGSGDFIPISWDDALDLTAEAMLSAERRSGPAAVWPYYYAGTMGLVMRDGINRLRHAKRYSGMYDTICVALAWPGVTAGTGRVAGTDPREMAKSDLIVIWGTNPAHTQINVMTHAVRARRERGARIAVVDIYETTTMKQADIGIIVKPGTDGAVAAAIMHVLFRDGLADWAYMEKYTDDPSGLARHLEDRSPRWAEAISGVPAGEIESLARLIGTTPRTFFRVGYGFSRSRNGAVNIHAVMSIPAVTGAWQHEGGGALQSNSGIYRWNKAMIEGLDVKDPSVRMLDQSRIGAVLTHDPYDLAGGPPVTAIFIQNTNPVSVAPEQTLVKRGFARDDLFTCVHEQFMTETARMADVVLPATMFLEHDDIYQGGGHQHIMLGPKLVDPPGECRSNHEVIQALARRVGAEHPGFAMTPRELIEWTLVNSGRPGLAALEEDHWFDIQPDFATSHFISGFSRPEGRFRFRPDWQRARYRPDVGPFGPIDHMPQWPDHWDVIEKADDEHPFRLATSPARGFLNSTFNETPTSRRREGRPTVMMHPADLAALGLVAGDKVKLGNHRGVVTLHVEANDSLRRGVLIAESIWPNDDFEDGAGINTLIGADQPAPAGGGAFHDVKVWVRKSE
jgi:anaerobic selenocysteine-containing dehydrogenase